MRPRAGPDLRPWSRSARASANASVRSATAWPAGSGLRHDHGSNYLAFWGARLWATPCRFRGTTLSSYIRKYKRERRLIADRPLMAEHYPELGFGSDPVTGLEAFEGILPLVARRSGVVRRIPVRIVFPRSYPDEEPRAFDYTHKFLPHTSLRHFYTADGRCCLWLPWDSKWQAYQSNVLLDFMAHLATFFNHQLLFDVSGKWPVPARGHGRDGYREFLVEKLGISQEDFPRFIPYCPKTRSSVGRPAMHHAAAR